MRMSHPGGCLGDANIQPSIQTHWIHTPGRRQQVASSSLAFIIIHICSLSNSPLHCGICRLIKKNLNWKTWNYRKIYLKKSYRKHTFSHKAHFRAIWKMFGKIRVTHFSRHYYTTGNSLVCSKDIHHFQSFMIYLCLCFGVTVLEFCTWMLFVKIVSWFTTGLKVWRCERK